MAIIRLGFAVDFVGNLGPVTNYNWTVIDYPSVTSILRQSPNGTSTNANSVTFQVAFSEVVSGVDPSDFTLSSNGSIVTASMQVSAVNGSIYNVTVNGVVGNGTLGLGLVNDGSIQSLTGIPLNNNLANTDFSFQPAVTYLSVSHPSLMLLTDLNGDGILDLATTSSNTNQGNVLLGNGDGTFQPRKTFLNSVGIGTSTASGDFNGDGIKDLLVTVESAGLLNLLAGDGNGSFQLISTTLAGAPKESEVGDFNNDGYLDVATASQSGNLMSVFLGNGNGTFQPRKTYSAGATSVTVESSDFNGDGNLDLVVANSGSSRLSLYLARTTGPSNRNKPLRRVYPLGGSPWATSTGTASRTSWR